jgi:hypothetical protein
MVPSSASNVALLPLQIRLPASDTLDTSDETPCFVFRNDFVNSGFSRCPADPFDLQYCEQDQGNPGIRRRHPLCCFYAIDVRHCQVQQNDVWFQFLKFFDATPAILGFPANCPISRTQNPADNATHCFRVVDNQYSQCFGSHSLAKTSLLYWEKLSGNTVFARWRAHAPSKLRRS